MEVRYKDKKLALLETDEAAETKLPMSVISSFRNKLVILKSAPDERTLRNWKSLHYEKLVGDRRGFRSIRLNDQWRVVFSLDTSHQPPLIVIQAVEDYH